jgi:uncharacterized RDD family membrane protein YckC
VKCPSCGYVSYLRVARCVRCGSRLAQAPEAVTRPDRDSEGAPKLPLAPPLDLNEIKSKSKSLTDSDLSGRDWTAAGSGQAGPPEADSGEGPATLGAALDDVDLLPRCNPDLPTGDLDPWHGEISDRLGKIRERRARARSSLGSDTSLELDFEHLREPAQRGAADVDSVEGPDDRGASHGAQGLKRFLRQRQLQHSQPSEEPGEREQVSNAQPLDEWSLDLTSSPAFDLEHPKPSPETENFFGGFAAATSEPVILQTAPLGRRFVAGLVDAVVLLAGAGIFALIFWAFGGRLTLQPANLAILGFIAAVIMVGYFACFTAFMAFTPGLLLMGLEVRNMEGAYPTRTDSALRGFGYIVSIGALMLGFIWAAVDSEGLTWHDRMSGTLVTVRNQR